MLRWQMETQRACEAYDWLVVETRGDDAEGWGCHLVYRGDRWGIASYRHDLVGPALARPTAFARSIIRPLASESLARAAFAGAPATTLPHLVAPSRVGAIVRWPGSPWLIGETEGGLLFWDVETREVVDRLATDATFSFGFSFGQIAIAPPLLTTRDGARDLAVWHVPSRSKVCVLPHTKEVLGAVFIGEHLMTCCSDSTLRLWNAVHGDLVRAIDVEHSMVWLARRPQGGLVACAGMVDDSAEGALVIVDETLAHVRTIRLPPLGRRKDAALSCLAWHPDGHHVVTGGSDDVVKLVDVETGTCVRTWHEHQDLISVVAVDADRIISADFNGNVRISAHDDDICFAAYDFGPQMIEDLVIDGDHIYASSVDGNIYVLP
jgi:WD40 repeat protein